MRCLLLVNGFRYKLHDKRLPGKPDIVLPKYKTVIFILVVSGMDIKVADILLCLRREEWWLNKINGNIANDVKSIKALKKEG